MNREWNPETGTAPPPGEITFVIDSADRFGKCRIRAFADSTEFHVDVRNPYSEYDRRCVCESVCLKLGYLVNGSQRDPAAMRILAGKLLASAKGPEQTTIEYPAITCQQLSSTDYDEEYLIEDILCARQHGTIGGPRKGLKTSLLIDAAISLATAEPFLGKFSVLRGCRVGVMSGESQFSTIQKNARAVAHSKGFELDNIDGIVWSDKLPVFGSIRHIEGLEKWITGNELEALSSIQLICAWTPRAAREVCLQWVSFCDSISEPCQERGVTLVVAHHMTKEAARSREAPELDWLSWSGFAEFSRQWWLVNRRAKYVPGTFRHSLWLSFGGSAGHGSLWAANIFEGSRTNRCWEVELLRPDELNEIEKDAQDEAKEAKIRGASTATRKPSSRPWSSYQAAKAQKARYVLGQAETARHSRLRLQSWWILLIYCPPTSSRVTTGAIQDSSWVRLNINNRNGTHRYSCTGTASVPMQAASVQRYRVPIRDCTGTDAMLGAVCTDSRAQPVWARHLLDNYSSTK